MRIFLALTALVAVGCASKGFNRGALRDQMGVTNPVTTDTDIKNILKRKANLPKSFRLAVYFRPPHGGSELHSPWRWTEQDKTLISTIASELKTEGIDAHVFPIVSSLVTSEDFKSIRIVAAEHGADAVLVVNGAGQMDRYINSLGWSYILVAPALFIPGSEAESLFMADATLWDVRNEYLYLSAEAEGTAHNTHVAAFGKKDQELYAQAKTAALDNLKKEIINGIKGIQR